MASVLALVPGTPAHTRLIHCQDTVLRLRLEGDPTAVTALLPASLPDLLVLAGMPIEEQAAIAADVQQQRRWRLVPVLYLVPADVRGFAVPGTFRPELDGLARGPLDSEPVVRRMLELAREGLGDADLLVVGPVELDAFRGRLKLLDREVELTEREAEILAILLARPDRTVSAAEIIERGWGAAANDRYLQILRRHVSNIRRKLEDTPARHSVRTVRGNGYRFDSRLAS